MKAMMTLHWICPYCERIHLPDILVCVGCGAPMSQNILRDLLRVQDNQDYHYDGGVTFLPNPGEKIYCPDPNRYGGYLEIGTVKPKPPRPSTVYR